MAKSIGHNIKIIDKDDKILIVIKKDAKLQDTASGKSKVLAKTAFFESIGNITGSKLENNDLGLNLLLTVRPKKAPKPEKAAKKKKPRLDDDDED